MNDFKNEKPPIECDTEIVKRGNKQILRYIWKYNGDTYCLICGDKIVDGYCKCFENDKS